MLFAFHICLQGIAGSRCLFMPSPLDNIFYHSQIKSMSRFSAVSNLLLWMCFALSIADVQGQYVHKIKADTVKLYNDACTTEFILQNATRNTSGFLYNKGNGLTEFRKALIKLTDSTYLIGSDTLYLSYKPSGNWVDLTSTQTITGNKSFSAFIPIVISGNWIRYNKPSVGDYSLGLSGADDGSFGLYNNTLGIFAWQVTDKSNNNTVFNGNANLFTGTVQAAGAFGIGTAPLASAAKLFVAGDGTNAVARFQGTGSELLTSWRNSGATQVASMDAGGNLNAAAFNGTNVTVSSTNTNGLYFGSAARLRWQSPLTAVEVITANGSAYADLRAKDIYATNFNGNATSATQATNSSLFNAYPLDKSQIYSTHGSDGIFTKTAGMGEFRIITPSALQSMIGLSSSNWIPYAGATAAVNLGVQNFSTTGALTGGSFRLNNGVPRGGFYTYNQVMGSGTDYTPVLHSEAGLYVTLNGTSTVKTAWAANGDLSHSANFSVGGISSLGTGDWPTLVMGKAHQRVGIFSNVEDGYLFIGNMENTVAAGKGGEIYLGARRTTGSPDFAPVILKSVRESGISGNGASSFVLSVPDASGNIATALTLNSSLNAVFAGNVTSGGTVYANTIRALGGGGEFLIGRTGNLIQIGSGNTADNVRIVSGAVVRTQWGTNGVLTHSISHPDYVAVVENTGGVTASYQGLKVNISTGSSARIISGQTADVEKWYVTGVGDMGMSGSATIAGTLTAAGGSRINGYQNLGTASGVTGGMYLFSASNDTRFEIENNTTEFRFGANYLTSGGYKPIAFYTSAANRLNIAPDGMITLGAYSGIGDRLMYLNNAGTITPVSVGTGLSFSSGTLSATGAGNLTGNGTAGYLGRWTSPGNQDNSLLQDNGYTVWLEGADADSRISFYKNYSANAVGIQLKNTAGAAVVDINGNVGAITITGDYTGGNGTFSGSVIGSGFGTTNRGTSQTFYAATNTGGTFYIGNESSVAGAFFTGSSAYASVLYTAQPIQMIISGAKRFEVNSGGATINGSLTSATGSTTSTIYRGTSSTYQGVEDYSAGTGLWSWNNRTAGASTLKYFSWSADGTEIMSLTKANNLTIGTGGAYSYMNPYSTVSVNTNATVSNAVTNQSNSSGAYAKYIVAAYGNSWHFGMGSSTSAYGNDFTFTTDASATNTPVFRLAVSGAATFSSSLTASSFNGAGAGLTGTAASLTVGNSTQWNGASHDFATTITNPASVANVVIKHTNGTYYVASAAAIAGYINGQTFNTLGNAATATSAANSTLWNGYTMNFGAAGAVSSYILSYKGNDTWGPSSAGDVKAWAGYYTTGDNVNFGSGTFSSSVTAGTNLIFGSGLYSGTGNEARMVATGATTASKWEFSTWNGGAYVLGASISRLGVTATSFSSGNGYYTSAGSYIGGNEVYVIGAGTAGAQGQIRITSNNYGFRLYKPDDGQTLQLTAADGGSALIGTWHQNGNYLAAGSITASAFYESSDSTLKDISTYHPNAINDFAAIEFTWKAPLKRDSLQHWGYAAQEVQKVLPNAVSQDANGKLTVNYLEAHTYKIQNLERNEAALKRKIEELEEAIIALKKSLNK
jgi:hypothetical protein